VDVLSALFFLERFTIITVNGAHIVATMRNLCIKRSNRLRINRRKNALVLYFSAFGEEKEYTSEKKNDSGEILSKFCQDRRKVDYFYS